MSFKNMLFRRWGETIRKTRLEQGVSLETLADLARVDPGHLSKVERGLAGFGDEARIRLSRALGRRVEEVFPYDLETPCPSVANAEGGDSSPTPATTAGPRSRVRSVEEPGESGREENPGNE